MSMNKYTLGTIVGAALLGLAKSKSGGRNDEQRTYILETSKSPSCHLESISIQRHLHR